MSSALQLLAPLSLEDRVDFIWHYDCVISPRFLRSSVSNALSPASARSLDQCQVPELGQQPASLSRPSSRPTPSKLNVVDVEVDGAKVGRNFSLNGPGNFQAGGTLNSSSYSSSLDSSFFGNSFSTTPSVESMLMYKDELSEISKSDSAILDADRRWLQKGFDALDANGDGKISKEELCRSMEKLGIHLPDESISHLFSSVDLKTEGFLDFDEFSLLYQLTFSLLEECNEELEGSKDEDLLDAFEVFDKDGDGQISKSELQEVLRSLGFAPAEDLVCCEEMIRRADEDGNG